MSYCLCLTDRQTEAWRTVDFPITMRARDRVRPPNPSDPLSPKSDGWKQELDSKAVHTGDLGRAKGDLTGWHILQRILNVCLGDLCFTWQIARAFAYHTIFPQRIEMWWLHLEPKYLFGAFCRSSGRVSCRQDRPQSHCVSKDDLNSWSSSYYCPSTRFQV